MPVQSVPIRQDCIIDMEVLEDFDHCKWSAGQDALLLVVRVEKSDVLVHVKDILVR